LTLREITPKALGAAKIREKNKITLSTEVVKVLKLELGDYVTFVKGYGFVILKKVE